MLAQLEQTTAAAVSLDTAFDNVRASSFDAAAGSAASMATLTSAVAGAIPEVITLGDVIADNLGGAFYSMGLQMTQAFGALAVGKSSFGDFAASALNNLGAIAIQLGTIMVGAGSGFALIPGFQASAGAVAFGLGLIVAGGAMQAIGPGTSTGGGGGSARGASATSSIAASLARDIVPRDESEGQMIALDINIAGESVERVIVPVMDDAIRRGRFRQLRPAFG